MFVFAFFFSWIFSKNEEIRKKKKVRGQMVRAYVSDVSMVTLTIPVPPNSSLRSINERTNPEAFPLATPVAMNQRLSALNCHTPSSSPTLLFLTICAQSKVIDNKNSCHTSFA
eukprot:TRINITY_DN37_c1_g1_i3.p1 TRINITY_DN37_c1_g1~~TRINITY_DN37_c1_g1_i3.p1  ORF type:complete len:129 (+),score=15.17 TRINITY_DN37_c1_g1_i3:49-387(+)